jgi:uncharacterized protein YqgC (DUF456 family)
MKLLGTILLIAGLVALVITGIDYMDDTKSLNLLGESFTVSKGNLTGVIISAVVFLAGLFIRMSAKK